MLKLRVADTDFDDNSPFTDGNWTEWLPTYAWAVEHPEGVIVVDTGQGVHLLETSRSYHPFLRWEVVFRIEKEEEVGPQLRALGIGTREKKWSSPICTWITMADLHISQTAKSWFHLTNFARRADGPGAFVDTYPIGGRRGSTQHPLISQRRRLAPLLTVSG